MPVEQAPRFGPQRAEVAEELRVGQRREIRPAGEQCVEADAIGGSVGPRIVREERHQPGADGRGALGVHVAGVRTVRRHVGVVAEEGLVDRLDGHPGDAHGQHAGDRHVDVHVAAEAADDLGPARRLELVGREQADPAEGVAPAGVPRVGAVRAPGERRHGLDEDLADVAAREHGKPLAAFVVADPDLASHEPSRPEPGPTARLAARASNEP
jgi:hypothetical protein